MIDGPNFSALSVPLETKETATESMTLPSPAGRSLATSAQQEDNSSQMTAGWFHILRSFHCSKLNNVSLEAEPN